MLLLLIVGMIGGAFYYFKVLKSKQNTKGNTALEEYDFEDDEETDEDEYEKEYETDDEEESDADSR